MWVDRLERYLAGEDEAEIAILSASFRSAPYLERNLELVRELNPGARFTWFVVQNTPAGEKDLPYDHPDFLVIPGPRISKHERDSVAYGSILHAKALQIAYYYNRNRRVLLLDPDCYIVRPDWIRRCRVEMRKAGHCFFGTPYHPERLEPFRFVPSVHHDFPTPICMFVERERLESMHRFLFHLESEFDDPTERLSLRAKFLSEIGEGDRVDWRRAAGALWRRAGRGPDDGLVRWFQYLLDARYHGLSWKRRTDIGIRVYRRYRGKVPHACCSVYFPRAIPRWVRRLRPLLPDALCAYPRRRDAWVKEPFPFLRTPARECWEQFYWRREPFAFHIGKVSYCPPERALENLDVALADFRRWRREA